MAGMMGPDALCDLNNATDRIHIAMAVLDGSVVMSDGKLERKEGAGIGGDSSELVLAEIRRRRIREAKLPGMFADPAWDMMLDLYAHSIEGRKVTVSSVCIASAVPPTTAMRWLKVMTAKGIVIRENSETDGRSVYVKLSDRAMDVVHRYLHGEDA